MAQSKGALPNLFRYHAAEDAYFILTTINSVVFSVWTRMLDLVGCALSNHRIRYCRLDGSMSQSAREVCLAQFKSDPEITVILISLMAGGTGYLVLYRLRILSYRLMGRNSDANDGGLSNCSGSILPWLHKSIYSSLTGTPW